MVYPGNGTPFSDKKFGSTGKMFRKLKSKYLVKEAILKGHRLHDSYYVTFWQTHNTKEIVKIAVVYTAKLGGKEEGMYRVQKIFREVKLCWMTLE